MDGFMFWKNSLKMQSARPSGPKLDYYFLLCFIMFYCFLFFLIFSFFCYVFLFLVSFPYFSHVLLLSFIL